MPQTHPDQLLDGSWRMPGDGDEVREDAVAAEIQALLAELVADLVD